MASTFMGIRCSKHVSRCYRCVECPSTGFDLSAAHNRLRHALLARGRVPNSQVAASPFLFGRNAHKSRGGKAVQVSR